VSAYEEELERCRIECLAAQARERRRVDGMSLEGVLHEMRADRQQRQAQRQEAARRALGSPPTGSFARGTAGLPGPRNARFVSGFRNAKFRP
jgi:hypothetical protein